MLTVCTGVKGRKEQMLDCLVESLAECDNRHDVILSVFDCGTPGLREAIREKWKHRLLFNMEEMPFARTYSLNKAAEVAPTDLLFFTDVDMTLPRDFVKQLYQNVGLGKAWFPVCFSLKEGAPRIIAPNNGYWRHTGYGMCGFHKKDFIALGKWNLRYMIYGAEDNDIHDRGCKKGLEVVRENCIGLFHNWHPVKKFGRENET